MVIDRDEETEEVGSKLAHFRLQRSRVGVIVRLTVAPQGVHRKQGLSAELYFRSKNRSLGERKVARGERRESVYEGLSSRMSRRRAMLRANVFERVIHLLAATGNAFREKDAPCFLESKSFLFRINSRRLSPDVQQAQANPLERQQEYPVT